MTPERWRQITEVFHGALERDVRDRAAFLADACAGDEGLRREVEVMLAQPLSSDGFLAGPAIVAAPALDSTAASVLTGRRFGPYQIQACIGAGGMGEVYCARDTKLGRDVAIKILPRAFTNDPERLARFEREARVLAALNHPHIGAIYGSEEAEGIRGLVSSSSWARHWPPGCCEARFLLPSPSGSPGTSSTRWMPLTTRGSCIAT